LGLSKTAGKNMIIIPDTPIWSKALRWRAKGAEHQDENEKIRQELSRMIKGNIASIIGPVRQEVLSGISNKKQFAVIKNRLCIIKNTRVINADYITAAEFSNECRRHGIQGSTTDFLICAVAFRNKWQIWTEDGDFTLYKQYIPVSLYTTTANYKQSNGTVITAAP
jgi:predicted nucleic acid-binding protein